MYSLWKKKKEEKKGQQNTELGAYFVFRLNPEAPLSGRKKNNLKTMNAAAWLQTPTLTNRAWFHLATLNGKHIAMDEVFSMHTAEQK